MLHIETLQPIPLLGASRSGPELIHKVTRIYLQRLCICSTLNGALHGRVKGKTEHRWSTYSSAQLPVRNRRELESPQSQVVNPQYLVLGEACVIANQRKSSRACV